MTGEHAAVIAVTIYAFLRWMLRPLANRLPAGITLAVDVIGAILLLPEYLLTTMLRRIVNRAAPLAFLYGEAVSSLAVLAHTIGLTFTEAVDRAAIGIGHRQAIVGGLIGTACLALLS